MRSSDPTDIVLTVEHASKIFPGNIVALQDASLTLRRGEVHCLLGANGAGKSTFLKIIAGAHRPTGGILSLDGIKRSFRSPDEAARAGISMIYQELDLIPQMTVAENLLLGRAPGRFGLIDRRKRLARATAALARVGAPYGAGERIERLSIANRQLAAIARSLTLDAKVIIMDEPSAALNETELARVFDVIRDLARSGVAILYVSHRMPEIRAIGDRVTALRGGRTIETFELAGTDEQTLVEAVLGRDRALLERQPRRPPGLAPVIEIDRLDAAHGLSIRDLHVRSGEIVGLSGLNGSGRTSLLRALFGDLAFNGEVRLHGKRYTPRRPIDAIRAGVALVPEDRKIQGLVLGSAIYRNAWAAALRHRIFIRHGALQRGAASVLQDLSTLFSSPTQPVRQLSGGNQQKVVLAKWVLAGSRVLLLDEPSRGLDVGAKSELYALIRRLAEAGAAVLVASSELDEMFVNCDRIWVLHEGRNTRCFDPGLASRDEILEAGLIGGSEPGSQAELELLATRETMQ